MSGEPGPDEAFAPDPLTEEETHAGALGAVAAEAAHEGPLEASTVGEPVGDARVLRSSALMSVGTVVSRVTGVVRGAALAAAIGVAGPVADMFGLGNTLPNIIYILIIGGALNAVFVPQLVRHMKDDTDGGAGFADRLVTLVGVTMLAVTVVAVAGAPWIVGLYTSGSVPAEQVALATDIARYCLPQIFFYGAFTMLSQILNAHNRFGLPMFAPIINNVVSIAAFLAFFWLWGTAPARDGVLTPTQTAVLGLGATIGVAAQAAVLVPAIRRVGYSYRPRFDFRGAGLGRAGSLAFWTVGLVLVNQVAYIFVVRLLGTAAALAAASDATAGGLVTYQNAHLVFILPHSVITVSVVTALLPRMSRAAADRDWRALAADIAGGVRGVAVPIVLSAALLIPLGPSIAQLLFGWGAASDAEGSVNFLGAIIAVFAVGLLPFTVYYVLLRGWYALEATRTAFWVTVVLNLLNLALAYGLFELMVTQGRGGTNGVAMIATGYVLAYWITAVLGWILLARRLGGLQTARTLGTLVRLLPAALVAVAVMVAALWALRHGPLGGESFVPLMLRTLVVATLGSAAYLLVAWALRVHEVGQTIAMVRRRLGR